MSQSSMTIEAATDSDLIAALRSRDKLAAALEGNIDQVDTATLVGEMMHRLDEAPVTDFIGVHAAYESFEPGIDDFDADEIAAKFISLARRGDDSALTALAALGPSFASFPPEGIAAFDRDGALTVPAGQLAWALQACDGVIQTRGTLPILACVRLRFDAAAGALCFSGADLDVEVTARLTVVSSPDQAPSDFCFPPGALLALARSLASDAIITLTRRETRLAVTWAGGEIELDLLPGDDLPDLAMPEACDSVALGPAALAQIARVRAYVSTEETRYYLNGICLSPGPSGPVIVATDGHRLRCENFPASEAMAKGKPIIPRPFVDLWLRLFVGCDSTLSIWRKGDEAWRVSVERPHVRLAGKLIEGAFPEWERAIPKTPALCLRANRDELMGAVKLLLASGLLKRRSSGVRFTRDDSQWIGAQSEDGQSIKFKLDAQGDDWPEVGYNAGYLLTALAAASGQSVTLRTADAGAPTTVTGESDQGCVSVIMPLRA
jgi:DNA polymerase III subunit beta